MVDGPHLHDLEEQARRLTAEEQLWLIERLVHHLRAAQPSGPTPSEADLAAMAADPDIQRELRAIERDFSGTEQDVEQAVRYCLGL
jgi:hypothetical protein